MLVSKPSLHAGQIHNYQYEGLKSQAKVLTPGHTCKRHKNHYTILGYAAAFHSRA